MELIKISKQILNNIKKVIDREVNHDKKNIGFSQLTQWFATGKITKGQIQKIVSFYETYTSGEQKDVERKKVYDEINILPWAKTTLDHLNRIESTKRKVHQYTGTNREVDRLTKTSLSSVRPSEPATTKELKVNEEINRFNQIINYKP